MPKKYYPSHRSSSHPKKLFLIGGLVLLVIIVLAALELTNVTHFFHSPKAVSGVIPATSTKTQKTTPTKNTPATTAKNGPAPATNLDSQKSGTTTATNSSGSLITPFGNFVSNHHPNLSSSPAPSQEQSVCNTTPGASCYIKFTQNGITKTLPVQTADSSGAVYWSWDVKEAGFTSGEWQITAVASLNGETKTANDPLNLEVQP